MTVAVESTFQPIPMRVESSYVSGERTDSPDPDRQGRASANEDGVKSTFNANGCEVLLGEPAIGLWASEAATKYGMTAVDALELLAFALAFEGEM
jgi:hypothetical protein